MKLSGQVAIVTGGSSGQGWAAALLFAQEGATLFKGIDDPNRKLQGDEPESRPKEK